MPQANEGACAMRPIVKLKTLAVALPLLAVGVMMHPYRASSQVTAQKEWKVVSEGNNCLGVAGGQVTEGAAVVVWPCNNNADQVGWTAGMVAPELHGKAGAPGTPANAIVSWTTSGPQLCVGAADDDKHLVMVPC